MLRKFFSLSLVVVAAGSFLSCKKDADGPNPACYAGTVVAFTCMDGVYIDVNPAYRIGAPATVATGGADQQLGNNVIAVVNTADLHGLARVGQQVYFTYKNDPARQHYAPGPLVCCFANDGSKTVIPHLVLSNVSTTACDSARSN